LAVSRKKTAKPQSPPANKNGIYNMVIKQVYLSRDRKTWQIKQFYKPFYSATGGLSFSSFVRKLEKKKNNPENPVNPV
jgi:hypothetical protein